MSGRYAQGVKADKAESRAQRKPYSPPVGYTRWRFELSWHGAGFCGWQSQLGARSVQDTFWEALSRLSQAHRPVAAGRTDSGVHAHSMTVHADLSGLRPAPERFMAALNATLPRDLCVLSAAPAQAGFHARFSCTARHYRYDLLPAPVRLPLYEGRAHHCGPLLFAPMREAATHLIGTHDFAAFATREERQTVRELQALHLQERGPLLEVFLSGESFLRHMVRAIVGTLVLVGQEKLPPERIPALLAARERSAAGPNLPPHGLYFLGASYGEDSHITNGKLSTPPEEKQLS